MTKFGVNAQCYYNYDIDEINDEFRYMSSL